MSDPRRERRFVLELLARLNRLEGTTVAPLEPPRPDVGVRNPDRSTELFEVTEIHSDEVSKAGSQARALEMRRASGNPHAIVASWAPADAMAAIRYRVAEKCRKAPGYTVLDREALSLLLVGSVPSIGAVASTYVCASFVTVDRLNAQLGECLHRSRFERAYIHLPLSGNGVWGWTRLQGWVVLREPEDSAQDGRQTLEALRGMFAPGVDLRGAKIFGRPR